MSIKIKIGKSLNVAVPKKEVKVMESRQKVAAEIDFDITATKLRTRGASKIKKSKNDGEESEEDHVVSVEKVYTQDHYVEWHKNKDKNLFEAVIDKMMVESFMDETFKPYIDEVREIIGKKLSKDKKRFAILCTLDKNRNLLRKAKVYNKTSVTKMEHIKDYIKILRDYVKVSEVEKKKFGEVMTPIDLVKEMLNKLPREVWSNPDLKWLDPCNGVGPFGSLVVAGLMQGLVKWEPDEEKRYKHIIENMVYVCELQPKNMFLWMCMMDPKDEYAMNVYCGSFLDGGFDKHMKEVWGIEKFDVVVGNPPYNDDFTSTGDNKLYLLFISKLLNKILGENKYLLFVTPKKAIENLSDLSKNRNYVSEHKKIEFLSLDTPSKYFGGVGSSFCYFLIKNIKDDLKNFTIEFVDRNNGISRIKSNIYLWKKVPKFLDDLTMSIIQKTIFSEGDRFDFKVMKRKDGKNFRIRKKQIEDNSVSSFFNDVYLYKIIDKIKASGITEYFIKEPLVDYDKKKVIFSQGGSYTFPMYDNGNVSCSDNILYLLVSSEEEGLNFVNFMNSELMKFLENCLTKGIDMDYSFCIKNIKKIDMSRLSCKEDIYNYYGITDEEIKFIESNS